MKRQKSDRVGFICEHDPAGLRTKPGRRACGGGGNDSTESVLLQTCFAGLSWLDLVLLGECIVLLAVFRWFLRTCLRFAMRLPTRFFALLLLPLLVVETADARTWKDQTGSYTIEGELFAFNDEHVVIERADGDLGMFKIDFLSEEDREYLRSAECAERSKSHLDEEQAWELVDGTKLVGTVVDYTRTKVTIQRRRGRIYVNDRRFDALPPIHQSVVIKMVGHFEQIADVDRDKFTQWVMQQRGQPRVFPGRWNCPGTQGRQRIHDSV
jgi:hypothetical protein